MIIEGIRNKIKANATIFHTGGFRPTNELGESWIGKVSYKKEGESLPLDKDGNEMGALAMFFIDDLNTYPSVLKDKYMCSVFISYNLLEHRYDSKGYYCIRLYTKEDTLVPCNWTFYDDGLSFPLSKEFVDNDYPVYAYELPDDIFNEIKRLEEEMEIDYYDDIKEEQYSIHKIGGYPSYIQDGGEYDSNFEFVFQITSDSKFQFNIVDSGNFYFSYVDNDWHLYWDFY